MGNEEFIIKRYSGSGLNKLPTIEYLLSQVSKAVIGQEVEFSFMTVWKKVDNQTWLQKNTCDGSYTFQFSNKRTHQEMIDYLLERLSKK